MHHQSLIVTGDVTQLAQLQRRAKLHIFWIWAWEPALWPDVGATVPTAFIRGEETIERLKTTKQIYSQNYSILINHLQLGSKEQPQTVGLAVPGPNQAAGKGAQAERGCGEASDTHSLNQILCYFMSPLV